MGSLHTSLRKKHESCDRVTYPRLIKSQLAQSQLQGILVKEKGAPVQRFGHVQYMYCGPFLCYMGL